ncbi:hypothetical protein [Micromonospora sp. b486]|uniref:hypothetical protein n=1 Tax=Micromonospora sp. b486 TaxID=3053986 RepID=UPI00259CFDA0|nr:hypothetical protein [Micromonospora sp. b486]MDM4784439.1 hypothetical protein [Micromonospora sp. b486]
MWWWAGDRDEVAALLPVAEGVLRWFAEFARDGLLTDVTGWVLLDWATCRAVARGGAERAVGTCADRLRRDGRVARRPRPGPLGARAAPPSRRGVPIFFDPARGG